MMTRFALSVLLVPLVAACSPHRTRCEQLRANLQAAISSFDADHDGKLSRAEWDKLQQAFANIAKAKAQQNHARLVIESPNSFDEYDRDRDGYIELNELSGGSCNFK
jgi:Ca2+-binding EF-hand superfamily protein